MLARVTLAETTCTPCADYPEPPLQAASPNRHPPPSARRRADTDHDDLRAGLNRGAHREDPADSTLRVAARTGRLCSITYTGTCIGLASQHPGKGIEVPSRILHHVTRR